MDRLGVIMKVWNRVIGEDKGNERKGAVLILVRFSTKNGVSVCRAFETYQTRHLRQDCLLAKNPALEIIGIVQ